MSSRAGIGMIRRGYGSLRDLDEIVPFMGYLQHGGQDFVDALIEANKVERQMLLAGKGDARVYVCMECGKCHGYLYFPRRMRDANS